MHLLLLHGNGGASSRFQLLLQAWQDRTDLHPVIPALSGFEGRPLPELPTHEDYWDLLIEEMGAAIDPVADDWVLYGHGIGGSLLMAWAARGYPLPGGGYLRPQRVIMNSVIGASLGQRWFPQLMKPLWVRQAIQRLVAAPVMRPFWERRLFQQPSHLPVALRRQFFADYGRCAAFPLMFDLITEDWYEQVLPQIQQQPFHFLWGQRERVVQAKYLQYWRRDFPKATFEVMAGWDHFPMLDQPEAFAAKLADLSLAAPQP
jgi:pimeloyl-ACP methyl ester carboxylesterase